MNIGQAEVIPMFVQKVLIVFMVVASCYALSWLADTVIKTKRAD